MNGQQAICAAISLKYKRTTRRAVAVALGNDPRDTRIGHKHCVRDTNSCMPGQPPGMDRALPKGAMRIALKREGAGHSTSRLAPLLTSGSGDCGSNSHRATVPAQVLYSIENDAFRYTRWPPTIGLGPTGWTVSCWSRHAVRAHGRARKPLSHRTTPPCVAKLPFPMPSLYYGRRSCVANPLHTKWGFRTVTGGAC